MQAEAVIAVHGGAGAWRAGHEEAAEALAAALRDGEAALRAGADALTAVQVAVEVLEDAPVLNAGRGAVPTASGAYELDAAVMDGSTRRAGSVAAVRGVRHPVALARAVLDSAHVLLVAEGARALAEEAGLELVGDDWFRTGRPSQPEIAPAATVPSSPHGTVGAVALDDAGRLAAATSTGGRHGQVDGRVGDCPLIGAGTYADAACAVSATGDGEELIRAAAGHHVATLVRDAGRSVDDACDLVLRDVRELGGTAGLIAVDADGTVALRFTTEAMARGFMRVGGEPFVAVRA
ncbi:MAG TPA: isoaspartyl peptidase/L-asparaginase [Solirubrobacteraceae bacterium]|nr:isoaspartyl peptidase/L-asparaginase [Solirubrobacteraceae bacterium]